jgi:hypothetical protein
MLSSRARGPPPRRYALGYMYPAYSNYKALEQKNMLAVREWSTYW